MSELPRKGDRIFVDGRGEATGPISTMSLNERSYYQFDGYRRAAEILVAHLATGDERQHPERLVYPIVFLYRHSLELCLKRLIEFGWKLVGKPQASEILASHSLVKLWRESRRILDAVNVGDSPEIAAFEACINQLNSVDPTSQAFRYASTKDGDALLPPKMRTIDLKNVAEVMIRLYAFLDAADFVIGVAIDNRSEMLAACSDLGDH